MSTIAEYFQQAELAFAAYVNLFSGMYDDDYIDNLKDGGMSKVQATTFAATYSVVDQYTDASGVAATVFKDKEGKSFLAIRGTESFGDINADYILAMGFPSYLNPQFIQLQSQVSQWLLDGTLSSGFTVAGHSLGGYLAAAIGTWFNTESADIYTFNAPGLGSAAGNILDAFRTVFGLADSALVDGICNVRGTAGTSLIAGIGAQLSPPILIETESNFNPIANHGIVSLTDALAVYSLFAELSPTLTMEDISSIIKADSYRADMALEITVQKLADILLPATEEIGSGDREKLYTTIQSLKKVTSPNLDITSFVGFSDLAIAASASIQNESGLAARYALVNLNPFTVVGEPGLYTRFNIDGELDTHSETNKDGDLSSQYLEDRAKFLHHLVNPQATVSNLESDIDFTDRRRGVEIEADNGMIGGTIDREYFWGKDADDVFTSILNTGDDHLYGMGGNDTLSGSDGDDYIEGGKGQDSINGGSGNDTFCIMGEDESYDTFYGGTGFDKILGSDHEDTIRVHNLNAANSIEIIDGGSGVNVIAGSGGNDSIDLTGIALTNIDRIEGGWGDDTITGSAGDDHIYGGENSDILKGMAGNDTLYGIRGDSTDDHTSDRLEGGAGYDIYHVGAGDIVSDSDHQGIVIFNGQQLPAGTLTQISQSRNYYESADNYYRARLDTATGTLSVSVGFSPHSFFIENFSSGNHGIVLQEYVPSPGEYAIDLTGTSHRDSMGILDFGSNPANWRLVVTDFPAGVTSNTPFYNEWLSSSAPNLEISGGDSGDYLFGFTGHDHIDGGAGNDIITGHLGSWNDKPLYNTSVLAGDLLEGGTGNDWITGTGGDDQIHGGDDDDIMQSYDGDDHLFGDDGNDVLAGGSHDAVLIGGEGDDALFGDGYFTGSGFITLDNMDQYYMTYGYAVEGFATGYQSMNFVVHNDAAEAGNDFLDGGSGRDYLQSGAGSDTLLGGDGHDALFGGIGGDLLEGGRGSDLLIGDNVDQQETAGDGSDYLYGGSGNDFLYGLGGDDFLYGNEDNDYISGGGGQDVVFGGIGEDTLYGDAGNDTLHGDEGVDILLGNDGDDNLHGGAGTDHLRGSAGNDTYVLGPGSGYDIISDTGGSNRISFIEGISASQIKVSQVRRLGAGGAFEFTDKGKDLWVEYTATDAVYIEDGMVSPNLSLEFSNGKLLAHNQLLSLLAESPSDPGSDPQPSYSSTLRRAFIIPDGSSDSPIMAGASLVMGSGYDAYGSSSLQSLYNYFKEILENLDPGEPIPTRIALGNIGGASSWTWNVAEMVSCSGNSGFGRSFSAAKSWQPTPRDPLVFDLDSDGIEMVGTEAGVLFDHNADGIKTGSGWINADDGLLVRDINGNETIDNGMELFGDQTKLANGTTAATGFAALADLDTNTDGRVDAVDETFAELKIWRDLNQDGVSQMNEMTALADLGISAIHLNFDALHANRTGNVINRRGMFSRTDETTGSVFDVSLAGNLITREFTDQIDIPETIADLPDLHGGGKVRDLREAATLSAALQEVLTRYTAADSRTEQLSLLDDLLVKWADTSGMAGSLEERGSKKYRVEYVAFGNTYRGSHMTGIDGEVATAVANAENPMIDEQYRHLIQQWNDRIHVLEAFNGSYFFSLPDQAQEGGGAINGMQIDQTGYSSLSAIDRSKPGLVINYSPQQLSRLEESYKMLRQSVYDSLCLQTRLQGYLDLVDMVLAQDGVSFDFTRVRQAFWEKFAADQTNALTDLIEFNRSASSVLSGTSWDGVLLMEEILRSQSLTPEFSQLCRDLDVSINSAQIGKANDTIILGDSSNQGISGNSGKDILLGGEGDSTITGGNGDDIISGGAGDDQLFGGAGNDIYIFGRGSGNDLLRESEGKNSIVFSNLKPTEIAVSNSLDGELSFSFRINDTGETLTTSLRWNAREIDADQNCYFFFADGTVWDKADVLRQSVAKGTEENDVIFGSSVGDKIFGMAGDDIILGNGGDDTMDGGTGDDTLMGEGRLSSSQTGFNEIVQQNGDDTYIFGRGYGHDIIMDGDFTPNTDRLKFKDDIVPEDLIVQRERLDLLLSISDTDDQITVQKFFAENHFGVGENHPYEIEFIDFADGTLWTAAKISDLLLAGSDNPETIIGYRSDDVIFGQGGSDNIEARTGNDVIYGGSGNDTIRAGLGNDFMDGGTGDDVLDGNRNESGFYDERLREDLADNDTYIFGRGDGHDTIHDYDWRSGNEDTLRFKEGVSASDVFFERIDNSTGDLQVILGDGTDSITVKNWFGYNSDYYKIERMEFVDGTVLDSTYVDIHLSKMGTMGDDILNGSGSGETFFGLAGNDILNGRDGDDSIDGGSGDDLLSGGKGNDSYIFNRGSGRDTVIEDYGNNQGSDTIILGPDILPSDVTVRQSAADLILEINDTEDRLIVKNYFKAIDPAKSIGQVRFADDQIWGHYDLQVRAILTTIGDETSEGDDVLIGTSNVDTLLGGKGNDLLFGLEGDDYLDGGAHRDWLDGGGGNDTLSGGLGDDVLFGGAGDDHFYAGPGNDIAWGGRGNDTYIFQAGDGKLTIEDNYLEEAAINNTNYGGDYGGGFDYGGDYGGSFAYGGDYGGTIASVNVLQFGPGIIVTDLIFSEQEGYLVIDIATSGDQVRLAGYAPDRPTFTNAVDIFRFSDGSEPSREDLLAQGVTMSGTSGDDIFPGTPGDDYLAGGNGNDQYTFNIGDGVDTIVDISTDGMANSIQFGDAVRPDNIQAVVENGTLVLLAGVNGDAVRFEGYDPSIADLRPPVGHFNFWNGASLSFADLLNRGYEIVGTPEEDIILGTTGADSIRGLAGDDRLIGGTGDDSYLFAAGDGVDIIDDIAGSGEGNMVILPEGSAAENIRLGHDPGSQTLILTEAATDNKIHLTDFNRLNPFGDRAVQSFRFGQDGEILAYEELLSRGFDIQGSADNDNLLGTAITDRIHGGVGDDILAGGTGNDFLFGEDGSDTYVFNQGDGIVHITDSFEPGAGNILRFGPGIEVEDLRRHLYFKVPDNSQAGSMIIVFDNGDEVWLAGFDPDDVEKSRRSVETFIFDDGTTLSFAELASFTFVIEGDGNDNALSGTNLGDRLYGRYGNDILFAGAGDDVLTGGTGDDEMAGGTGRDVYAVSLGDGSDTIDDAAENGIGNNILFGDDIEREEIVAVWADSTLTIQYGTLGDQVRITNFDPNGVNGSLVIDTFQFGDGSSVGYDEFLNHGAITVDAEGQWQYAPEKGYWGEDCAEVSVSDGIGGIEQTTLRILVNTYVAGAVSLPEETMEIMYLRDIGKADLEFYKDGGAMMIDVRHKGSIKVNGYFLAQEHGIKRLATKDGPLSLEKDYIVDGQNWCTVLNGVVHGLLGDKLLQTGTARPDTLLGGKESDVIIGSDSSDFVLGFAGDDLLVGGNGNDNLSGNDGNDGVYGDWGGDDLEGGSGNDFLIGGEGDDKLRGGSDNDHLNGGQDNDTLTGGSGNDIFIFDTVLDQAVNMDTITDFMVGEDKVELAKTIFSALPEEGTLFSDHFLATPTGVAGDNNDYMLYNTTTGALFYDRDGNGHGIAVEFANLIAKPELTAKDFVIAA